MISEFLRGIRCAFNDLSSNAEDLRRYAKESGLKFYPRRFVGFLDIKDDIEQYIREKAREDLPESQFTCTSALIYPRDKNRINERMMEIGGILGFDGALSELTYSKNYEIIHKVEGNRLYSIARLSHVIDTSDLKKGTSSIIRWHTHARDPNLSKGDVDSGNGLIDIFSDFLYCEILYCPGYDRFFWYEYETV